MSVTILDTNVVSELMKPTPDIWVNHWISNLDAMSLVTTSITIAEITFGLARLPKGARQENLIAAFDAFVGANGTLPILDVTADCARHAGNFCAVRQSLGLAFPIADMLIAGVCKERQFPLATRNTKDFFGLPIETINPWNQN